MNAKAIFINIVSAIKSCMPKVAFIGTSHISKQSLDEIRYTIKIFNPDCIAVELDARRYHALLHGQGRLSLSHGLTYLLLGWMQRYLGNKTGMMPGLEMITAIRIAQENNIKVALIDKDIAEIALKIKNISAWKKFVIFSKILGSLVIEKEKLDLTKVPDEKLIRKALSYMRKNMPDFYRILITERNEHMAENIKSLSKEYNKILVIVGAAHKIGLEKMI
jgi:pheromone shutdown protein TraB